MVPYKLVRSKRKTAAIHILRDGSVELRVPARMPQREIDRFVAQKEGWITAKQAQMLAQQPKAVLQYGGTLRLLGRDVPIAAAEGRPRFDGQRICLPPQLAQEEIRAACEAIYRTIAKEVLAEKAAVFAAKMGLAGAYAGLRITSAKTRWGSCSKHGGIYSLNFSWRLMMAGESEIDYVVVHELAHIRQMNHSPQFWAEVAAAMPEYQQHRKQLKQLQAISY